MAAVSCDAPVPPAMPDRVRDRLYFGDINDAIAALTGPLPDGTGVTHVLSVVSSASISFFTDYRPGLSLQAEEVRRVVAGEDGAPSSAVSPGRLMRVVEKTGKGLTVTRMAVPLRDTEEENLLDHLEPCLDFIDEGRKEGSVLVHCFAGVSRSATIITAYLMRTEQKSLEAPSRSSPEASRFEEFIRFRWCKYPYHQIRRALDLKKQKLGAATCIPTIAYGHSQVLVLVAKSVMCVYVTTAYKNRFKAK
uniref:Uncharacterized protein n=1 Tax=Avena sativa TaxID=4498 RepID=A0ACD5XPB3_AVESA